MLISMSFVPMKIFLRMETSLKVRNRPIVRSAVEFPTKRCPPAFDAKFSRRGWASLSLIGGMLTISVWWSSKMPELPRTKLWEWEWFLESLRLLSRTPPRYVYAILSRFVSSPPACFVFLSDTLSDFSRSLQRILEYKTGGFETINFVLTKSRVSDSKRRRISHLVQTRYEFKQLVASSWEDVTIRESVGHSATLTRPDGYEDIFLSRFADLEDYEAAWGVLQAVSMDRTYLKKTEYNLFTLIRLGNSFSRQDQVLSKISIEQLILVTNFW